MLTYFLENCTLGVDDRSSSTPRSEGSVMRKKAVSVLARVLAVVALVVGGVAVATPAQAVTCYGDYCSGKDPQSSGCAADAFTVTSWGNSTFMLETRWSPTCKTNWGRITLYDTGIIGCTPSGTLKAVQDTGYTQSTTISLPCSTPTVTQWTPMIYSPVHHVRTQFVTPSATYSTPWA